MKQSGSLCVVGLGPGAAGLMTGQAQDVLRHADVVIGYEGYFAWVADLLDDKECIALPLTHELARAQLAVDRALAGQAVCVISSGDAGIYGMASLVLEVIEQRQAAALLADVLVVPGVSAVNACASLLGAPLGHDFAVLSLSDLLTPWTVIEKRLTAVAEADFVMVHGQSQERPASLAVRPGAGDYRRLPHSRDPRRCGAQRLSPGPGRGHHDGCRDGASPGGHAHHGDRGEFTDAALPVAPGDSERLSYGRRAAAVTEETLAS